MKADTIDLAAIFERPVRYLVPMFQRPYVWKKETEWMPLWDDIRSTLERQLDDNPNNNAIPHFLGAVVLDQVLMPIGMVQARFVIDGQQRLTTMQLFISAVRSLALEQGLNGPSQMLGKLLFNDEFLLKHPDDRFKVVPTVFDRESFQQTLDPDVAVSKSRMRDAFDFFREAVFDWAIANRGDDEVAVRFEVLSTVLWKLLVVVAIDLEERDNAQVIFETLNARGTPLLAADLIKNHLFQMAIDQGHVIDDLYNRYWQPLDQDWWRAEVQQGRLNRPRLDSFMNHWLSMRLGEEVVSHQLFPGFKRHVASLTDGLVKLLGELALYATVYEAFERKRGEDSALGKFLHRLNVMEVTTSFPLLLWLFGPDGITNMDERQRATNAIESWLARRVIVRGNTQGYTALFVSLLNHLRKSPQPSARDIVEYLRGLEGERGYWPTDEQVKEASLSAPVYNTITRARLRMIIEAIEEHLRARFAEETNVKKDLTIEHVLPQEWRTHWELPPDGDLAVAEAERDLAKQTIGNLTLVTSRLNPKMSNGPWKVKREALRQLSVLLVSSDIRDAQTWDEQQIRLRSARLADIAIKVWPGPDETAIWGPLPPRRRAEPPATVGVAAGLHATTSPKGLGVVPPEVSDFIQRRSSGPAAAIALEFAGRLAAHEELELRTQRSRNEPWYFQVRTPRFRQVLAYVNVSSTTLRIDYRLPKEHGTGGKAATRDNFYGITLRVIDKSELDFAMRLVDEALAQPTERSPTGAARAESPRTVDPSLIRRAYRESPEAMKRFLGYVADQSDRGVPNTEIAEFMELTRTQLAGMLGAFGRRWANRYQQRDARWFFDAEWMAEADTDEWKWHYRMVPAVAEIVKESRAEG